jgi:hypothetical protein
MTQDGLEQKLGAEVMACELHTYQFSFSFSGIKLGPLPQ